MDKTIKILFISLLFFIILPAHPMRDKKKSIRWEKKETNILSNAFDTACIHGDLATVQSCINAGENIYAVDEFGYTPMRIATAFNQISILEFLIELGADVSIEDNFGWTLLHVAALNWRCKAADLLIRNGADVNARNSENKTPLHLAASHGWSFGFKMVKLLVDSGAQINVEDNVGETPLHEAAKWPGPCSGNVPFLLDCGANAHSKDNFGNTPLYNALFAGNYKNTLLLITILEEVERQKILAIYAAAGDRWNGAKHYLMDSIKKRWLNKTKELIKSKSNFLNKDLITIAQLKEGNCLYGSPSRLLQEILNAGSFNALSFHIKIEVEENILKILESQPE